MHNQYGYFTEDGREFVITRPETPLPWVNLISNNDYCMLVSQTGGGYSFVHGSGCDRILRALPGEQVLVDRPGRYLYLRDDDSGDYWSLNWQPVCRPPQEWECRHGLGYTRLRSRNTDIEGEALFFVPLDEHLELWGFRLTNRSDRPRRLSSFAYAEFTLGCYEADLLERSFHALFNDVVCHDGIIYASKRYWPMESTAGGERPNLQWDKYVFMAASVPPEGFDCAREEFVGIYHDWQNPVAVAEGRCRDSQAVGRDAIGALWHRFALAPGESVRFHVILGVVPRQQRHLIPQMVEMLRSDAAFDARFERLREYWNDYLPRLWVDTPNADFNLSVNVWNKYQTWITAHWARMASYYIGGSSLIGYRDLTQDILGILPNDLEMSRQRTLWIVERQLRDGSTVHNWDPLTNTPAITGHSDDPLWGVMAILNYLRESGDFSFLEQEVPFLDAGKRPVRDHLLRGLGYALARRSPRGLSLMGAADWNDGLNFVGLRGRGESVMTSHFLCWMLRDTAELMAVIGDTGTHQRLLRDYHQVRDAINRVAWDGEWYWRASTDEGALLGSATNEEGRIYLNAQTWAVLSGVAEGERARQCLDAVHRHLDTEFGPALFLPAYQQPDPAIGIITRFAPGTKENGTIFNHPVCWAVIAECILGRGNLAFDYWQRTSFLTRGRDPDRYRVEPYVYAEYIYGPDHPQFGRGEFTWTTGTAAWMWRACIDWICGVRPTFRGLVVDPCVPDGWEGHRVRRNFRGATYEITVENPERVSKGVARVTLDGRELESPLLPDLRDGDTHQVHVLMGLR
ncbi:MAG: glycosyl transferase family 36 [Armatimonadetes bacterium]|nr:glycosyl transferase family 36 [Armatimonadota bacterium]